MTHPHDKPSPSTNPGEDAPTGMSAMEGTVFDLDDERTQYLVEALQKPYREAVLVARYNAQFNEQITVTDLKAILRELKKSRELPESPQTPPPKASKEPGDPASIVSHPSTEDDSSIKSSVRQKYRNHFSLFNPQALFGFLVNTFGFLRHFVFLVPLACAFSIAGLVFNQKELATDLQVISLKTGLLEHVIFTMFTTNLATQLLRGSIAHYFGLATPSFGLTLIAGLLPRFNLRIEIPPDTPKRAQLWVAGAPVLARLILIPLGAILWMSTRNQGTGLPFFGLALTLLSMISLLFVANPLMGNAGYRFLSIWFDNPKLREKAFRALRYRFSRTPEVVSRYVEDSWPLRIYAFASIVFFIALAIVITLALSTWLELHYGGLGVAVSMALIVYVYIRIRPRLFPNKRKPKHPPGIQNKRDSTTVTPLAQNTSPQHSRMKRIRLLPWRRLLLLLLITGALFLPYHYEAGGPARIYPIRTQEIHAQYPGILEKIYFNGGEWLEQGTIIAEMTNLKQRHDVESTLAMIKRKQEELQVLLTTPTPEELALARQALETAKTRLKYSQDEAERMRQAYKQNSISYMDYQAVLKEMELDRQVVSEKEANLAAIENKVNPHEIEALRAELELLQRDLDYYRDTLERTRLRMPISGRIVTMNLKNLENKYLDDGDFFAQVEDSSKVRVEVEIPEADMDVVSLGDRIRLKLTTFPDKIIEGKVSSIYPTSSETDYGNIVKIVGLIDNPDNLLRSGMSGHAKIEGQDMTAGIAFSRALVRFFRIEVWSWLP